MTTELEKQFFECFGIEPKHFDGCKIADIYWNNEELANKYGTFDNYMNKNCVEKYSGACFSNCEFAYDKEQYPEITDRKLLQLICKEPFDFEILKNDILERYLFLYNCEILKDELKQQVKALFEGEE